MGVLLWLPNLFGPKLYLLKNTLTILLLLLTPFYSFSQTELDTLNRSQVERRQDTRFYQIGSAQPFSGIVMQWHTSGQKKVASNYVNGLQHGLTLSWYSSGIKKTEENYKEGQQDGTSTMWDENGEKKLIAQFSDGILLKESKKVVKPKEVVNSKEVMIKVMNLLELTNPENSSILSNYRGAQPFNAIFKKVFNTADSLKALGIISQMDTAVYTAAGYLDQINPLEFFGVAVRLFEIEKYNESAFLLYLGRMRLNLYVSAGSPTRSQKKLLGSAENEHAVEMMMLAAELYIYFGADVNNAISVLQASINYHLNHDVAAYPRELNEEKYVKETIPFNNEIARMDANKEAIALNYESSKIEILSIVKEEEAIAESKLLFQAGKSIVGKWRSGSNSAFEFSDKGNATLTNLGGTTNFEYEVDYSRYPVMINLKGIDPQNPGTIQFIAEFFSETEVLIARGLSFQSYDSHIYSKKIAGEKNYSEFVQPKRTTHVPTTNSRVSNKELERFWQDIIKANLDLVKDSIVSKNTQPVDDFPPFPVTFQEFMMIEENHSSGYTSESWDYPSEEFRAILKDLNYKFVEQVALDDGSVALMIYFLGKKYYQNPSERNSTKENYQQTKRYNHYGLLFKKIEGTWKVINSSFTVSSASIEWIKARQNELINGGVYNLEIGALVNQNIRALSNPRWGEKTRSYDNYKYFGNIYDQPLDTKKIIDQTNFPLKGNWGNALGLTSDSSTWTKSDFATLIKKLFDKKIMRVYLYEAYRRSGIDARGGIGRGIFAIDYTGQHGLNNEAYNTYNRGVNIDNPLTFTIINYGGFSPATAREYAISIDGVDYESQTTLKFEKISGSWKLTTVEWEGRPYGEHPNAKEAHPTDEVLASFWDDNIKAIIDFDKDKIITQAEFPLVKSYYMRTDKQLSKEEFSDELEELFSQSFRNDLLGNSAEEINVGVDYPQHKVNGIYIFDPVEVTLKLRVGNVFLKFKKVDDKWFLFEFQN